MKPYSRGYAPLIQGATTYHIAPTVTYTPVPAEVLAHGPTSPNTYIITSMDGHAVDGPMEAVAHCAFTSFRFLWSEIDRKDDVDMFKMEMRTALEGANALESLRRTLLEWGHSMDLVDDTELFTELAHALGAEAQEPLPLGF